MNTLVYDSFAKGILNGWIVAFNKMPIDELNREGRFSYIEVNKRDPFDSTWRGWWGEMENPWRPKHTYGSAANNGDLALLFRGHSGDFIGGVSLGFNT